MEDGDCNADRNTTQSKHSVVLGGLFLIYEHFFRGGPFRLVRNWAALITGLLFVLSKVAPGVFKSILVAIVLLPILLAALIVKLVPLLASAIGWGERLGIVTTDKRISLVAQAVWLISCGEDFVEYIVELIRR